MSKKIIISLLIVATVISCALTFVACNSNPIVGTWKSEDGLKTIIFKKDGTGSGDYNNDNGIVDFTWTYDKDKNNLKVNYKGGSSHFFEFNKKTKVITIKNPYTTYTKK